MWDNATIMMLVEGTFVTLYMTLDFHIYRGMYSDFLWELPW